MKLKKYLEITGVSIAKFAKACEINENTMNTYVHEKSEPSLKNALKINEESLGVVELEDLIVSRKDERQ